MKWWKIFRKNKVLKNKTVPHKRISYIDYKQFQLSDLPSEFIEAMESMRYNPQAKCYYNYFSGGLQWSDEGPEVMEVEGIEAYRQLDIKIGSGGPIFRILLAYRSSLIRNKPRLEFKNIWDTLHEAFPHWLLFRTERSSVKHLPTLLKQEHEMMSEL